ncbi:ABC-type glycerol-3-phosphate transport system, substrate-binding protein [Lachnospiraceae bacterium YSD2013]|nr:ABC-type glycerol-3-phosphate transport system, substrate-binding protein [Lachnospiraceae bacterium YSD2013]
MKRHDSQKNGYFFYAVAILLLVMTLFASCGYKTKNGEKRKILRFEEKVINSEIGKDTAVEKIDYKIVGDKLLAAYYGYSLNASTVECKWGMLERDGRCVCEHTLSGEQYICDLEITDDGTVAIALLDEDGKAKINIRDLDNHVLKQYSDEDSSSSFDNLYCYKEGILADGSGERFCFDYDLNLLNRASVDDDHIKYYVSEKGNLYEEYRGEGGSYEWAKFDIDTGKGKNIASDVDFEKYYLCNGSMISDFALYDDKGIYIFDENDSKLTKIFDFMDSYISNNYDYGMYTILSKKEIMCCENSVSGWDDSSTQKIVLLRCADGSEERIIINVASLEASNELKNRAVEFNKGNSEYAIEIVDYSQYKSYEDQNGDISKLNLDLVSKKDIDILVLNKSVSMNRFAGGGFLEDLTEYIESDNEISREDLFDCVISATTFGDEILYIVPQFELETVIGKKSIVGEMSGWNANEFANFMNDHAEMEMFYGISRTRLFEKMLSLNMGNYVDNIEKKCNFESEDFIELLNLAKLLDKNTVDAEYDSEKEADAFRNDKVALCCTGLSGIEYYKYYLRGIMGEDITLIGYPTYDRVGAGICCDTSYAIVKSSKEKDAAWSFIREVLLPDYQNEYVYNIPATRASFEKRVAEELEKEPEEYFFGNVAVVAEPLSRQELNYYQNYIDSLTKTLNNEEEIISIIEEEAGAFFAENKTAEEVARVIQSRVTIWLNEK